MKIKIPQRKADFLPVYSYNILSIQAKVNDLTCPDIYPKIRGLICECRREGNAVDYRKLYLRTPGSNTALH